MSHDSSSPLFGPLPVSTSAVDRRLGWLLLAALVIRIAFFGLLGDGELRMDELQYQEIATNLVAGEGFALDGRLTSWRPPLYPALLAALYTMSGTTDPMVARIFQALLSLGTALLAYGLGRRLFGESTALVAAGLVAFYPSLLFYNNHLLTEVVCAFLVTLMAYGFALYLQTGRPVALAATGGALGLAVLTRDSLWPMVGVIGVLIGAATGYRLRRWTAHAAVLGVSFLIIAVPWVVRNTQLQGTFTLIATNNGPGILAGNNEYTPDDRPWRYHGFEREERWRGLLPDGLTEGQRQRLAFRQGIAFMLDHPGLTGRRAVIKAANVWGLEREIVGTVASGGYGDAWRKAIVPLGIALFGAYCIVLIAGLTGLAFALARGGPGLSFHLFVVALLALVTAVHALAFGHPRYHLPLIPLLCVYAGRALSMRREVWHARRSSAFAVSCALGALAIVIWLREILVVEFPRIQQLLR